MDKERKVFESCSQAENLEGAIDKKCIPEMSSNDIAKLIHELETHQIELEMQNNELIKTQSLLTEMRDAYSELYDFAPIGYLTTDYNGLIIQSNITISSMLEVPRSNLANTMLSNFIFREDQDIYYKHQLEVQKARHKTNCELRLRKSHGNYFWASLDSIYINNPDSERSLIRTVLSDISERKQAETKLRASEIQFKSLAENSQDYIIRYDKHCRHLYLNKAAYQNSRSSKNNFIGKTHRELGFEKNLCDLWESKIPLVINTKKTTSGTSELESANGKIFIDWRLFPEFDTDGRVNTVLAVSRDITESRKIEQRLFQAQKMESLGVLSGGIAHDFNNLLGIIHGNAELLHLYSSLDEKPHRWLDSILKATKRATKLTRQLLGFSKSQAVPLKATDINQVIIELECMIERSLTNEITVNYQLDPELWPVEIVRGDLEDVLLNLASNARDAMSDSGQFCIETSNKTLDKHFCTQYPGLTPGDYVYIAVSDNGEGIPAEQIKHIFDPFYTSKPQGQGTGLGLAMAFGFTQRSNGYIDVYSELGLGSTFYLFLPRTENSVQRSTPSDPQPILAHSNECILVVDDNEGLRDFAQTALESLGYQVSLAKNAKQALDILKSEASIDLLFSDIVMPGGLTGYELAEQAVACRPDLNVLLTSGYTNRALAQNNIEKTRIRLLNKPYTISELSKQIRATFDNLLPTSEKHSEQDSNESCSNKIEWVETMSVGVKLIDDDHKWLLKLIKECQKLTKSDSDVNYRNLMGELETYANAHFEHEESLMAATGYPGLENHKKVHRMYSQQVKRMQRQLDRGESCNELCAFLHDWWIEHIQTMDSAYTSYFEDNKELVETTLQKLKSNNSMGT